jgi:hypothetical protein
MSPPLPIREIAHLRLTKPTDDRWIEALHWIPVSSSELHLVCRYFPIVVRSSQAGPSLGVLLDERLLASPLCDASGQWRAPYRPIALRCFPFESRGFTDDLLADIHIDPNWEYLSPVAGAAMIDASGQPARFLIELHRLFGLLNSSEQVFASPLDQYLIADLLLPLMPDTEIAEHKALRILNAERFANLSNAALCAMARHSFRSIDIAVACLFSLQNLKQDLIPKGRTSHQLLGQTSRRPDPILLDNLPLALDDGDLVPLNFASTALQQ